MSSNREYEKFINTLARRYFTLKEIRKFIENDFVTNVMEVGPDPEYKNFVKYLVKLVEGDVYTVYATT